jgi:aryl-alcohol dehydrogenase-like predicted oxidoreductase
VTTVLLGATKEQQLAENLEAADLVERLSPEVMNRVDELLGNKPAHPQY